MSKTLEPDTTFPYFLSTYITHLHVNATLVEVINRHPLFLTEPMTCIQQTHGLKKRAKKRLLNPRGLLALPL